MINLKKASQNVPPKLPLVLEVVEVVEAPLSLGVLGSIETWFRIAIIHSCWRSSAADARFRGSRMKHFERKSIPCGLSCSVVGRLGGFP